MAPLKEFRETADDEELAKAEPSFLSTQSSERTASLLRFEDGQQEELKGGRTGKGGSLRRETSHQRKENRQSIGRPNRSVPNHRPVRRMLLAMSPRTVRSSVPLFISTPTTKQSYMRPPELAAAAGKDLVVLSFIMLPSLQYRPYRRSFDKRQKAFNIYEDCHMPDREDTAV
ncbi:hypothetical protein LZ554_005896 [Drepanopeziza brunnea f. sp. 'monogermtubi']|nr:hypothetical protein LZ554_005896 [Drepanopeziza brunnea f. sp. 'monogermtubi']